MLPASLCGHMPPPTADFDSPWKEAIDRFFPDFMALFFREIAAEIDWRRTHQGLDTELQSIAPDAAVGRRYVDKLIRVWLRSGEERWIVIHIEVQSYPDAGFELRMFTYHYRLLDRYGRRVVSLAVLTDDRPEWRPVRYRHDMWGCTIDFRFPTVKLLDLATDWTALEASANPFATVVIAQVTAHRTRHDDLERARFKLAVTRGLYNHGFGREDIIELFRFIDWMLRLPEALESSFRRALRSFEQEKQMPYVTWIERKGIERGRRETTLQHLLLLLRHRFQEVPADLQAALERLDAERLDALMLPALTVSTIQEIEARVEDEPPAGEATGNETTN